MDSSSSFLDFPLAWSFVGIRRFFRFLSFAVFTSANLSYFCQIFSFFLSDYLWHTFSIYVCEPLNDELAKIDNNKKLKTY